MIQLQDDGKIKGPSGNMIDLGKGPNDPIALTGTVLMPGTLILGAAGQSLPGAGRGVTNTTMTIVGTTAATLLFDSKSNGALGTAAYSFTDLVFALKSAGVIAT